VKKSRQTTALSLQKKEKGYWKCFVHPTRRGGKVGGAITTERKRKGRSGRERDVTKGKIALMLERKERL